MRSLTLTGTAFLVAALMTGCDADAGPTAAATPGPAEARRVANQVSFTLPLDETFVSPCNGETIHLTGTLSAKSNLIAAATASDTLHYELQVVVSETGTGQTTGAAYRSHDVNHEGFSAPADDQFYSHFTEGEKFYFISTTPGLSFRGQFFVHFVNPGSGDFKFTRDVGSLECRV
jgi:hypothetical protein